jgi:hypothetical protein
MSLRAVKEVTKQLDCQIEAKVETNIGTILTLEMNQLILDVSLRAAIVTNFLPQKARIILGGELKNDSCC